MNNTKTYLNVSYAQKDVVKALGARWDPAHKKWYVPANIDLGLFDAWRLPSGSEVLESNSLAVNKSASPSTRTNKDKSAAGVITFPADKSFVAYDGKKPPWE